MHTLKLIDFGLSTAQVYGSMNQMVGSCFYMAPEVIRKDYNRSCDLWSAAIILYIMLSGYPPFAGETDEETIAQIIEGEVVFDEEEETWQKTSQPAKDLILKLLVPQERRLNVQGIFQHPWMSQFQSMSKSQLMSLNTLGNLKNYSEVNQIKRAFMMVIANRLPAESIEKYKRIFHKLQKNKSFNSEEAFIEGMKKLVNEQQAKEIFDVLDLDGTKKVYWSEFLAAVCRRDLLLMDQNLKEAFESFDLQKRGFITSEDFKTIVLGEDPTHLFTDSFEESFVSTFGAEEVNFEIF